MIKHKKLLWSALPSWTKASLYHRFIHPPSEYWEGFFTSAPLRYAEGVEVELKRGDRMHGQIAFAGYHERALSKKVAQLAEQEGGLFVDVGANIGYFSLLWVAQAPDRNQAVAVEPSPRVLPLLKRNIQDNQFDSKIKVLEGAAGPERKKIRFDEGPELETGWGGPVTREAEKSATFVEQYRLDEAVDQEITLMKIDAEGADHLALRGSRGLLETNRIQSVCFEHNLTRAKRLGIEQEAPFCLLQKYGYEVEGQDSMWWASIAQ